MRTRGIRPENEIFLILLIVLIVVFAVRKPKYVDAALSINISENFGTKTARITNELKSELLQIAKVIDKKSQNHRFDGLEIIGHADTESVSSRYGSQRYDFDFAMAEFIRGQTQNVGGSNLDEAASNLARNTASNAELAMVRAVVVTQFFQELRAQGELFQNIEYFVPMSAGAMVDTNYRLDTTPTGLDDAKRRRIEFQLFSTKDRSRDDREKEAP